MAIVYEDEYRGKSKLGLGIESILKMLQKKGTYSGITKDTECKELSKFVSDITGGNVTVTIGAFNFVNAYAQVPLLDNSNPLIMNSMTTWRAGIDTDVKYYAFKRHHPELVGGYNFKTGKFTGWCKELEFNLCLGYRCIYPTKDDNDMNPSVATFILLHEFGHLIEKILGMGTLLRESYILNQAHFRLMNVTDSHKRAKVLRHIMDEEGIKDGDEVVAAEIDDRRDAAYTILLGKARHDVRSELDSYGYDQTGSESLADYFAVKNGYAMGALYLATPRTHVLQPDDIHYIAQWCIVGAAAGTMLGMGPIGGVAMLGMAYSALIGYSYDTTAKRYDDVPQRLERVLNGYIESIKTKRGAVSSEEIMEVKKMIKTLESMPRDQRGVVQSIFEYANPRGRRERNARELQKDLESLANHKLNIKAREYMA